MHWPKGGLYGPNHAALIPICVDLGDAMRALGELADAKALYERALAIDPDAQTVADTLCGLGRALEHLGDLQGEKHTINKPSPRPKRKTDLKVMDWCWLHALGNLKRGAALGKVAFRDACPAAAATLRHIEIALDGGAVISHAVH